MTTDHLGSPRIFTDKNGGVIKRQDYSAFGEATMTSQRSTNAEYTVQAELTRKDYTGYEKDNESGLEFAQARYYNTTHGRFTSVDPLTASATIRNPQTFNRYSYVLNSPYKFTDPLGLVLENATACGRRCSSDRTYHPNEPSEGAHDRNGGSQAGSHSTSNVSPAEGEPAQQQVSPTSATVIIPCPMSCDFKDADQQYPDGTAGSITVNFSLDFVGIETGAPQGSPQASNPNYISARVNMHLFFNLFFYEILLWFNCDLKKGFSQITLRQT